MILVVSDLWLPFPGGAERLIFNVARDLQRRGFDVHAVTGYQLAQQFDGPPVDWHPFGVFDNRPQGLDTILAIVDELQPSAILTHHLYASQYGVELCATGIPLVQLVLSSRRLDCAALGVFISRYVYDRHGGRGDDLIITPPAFDDIVADTHGDAIGFVKPIEHKGIDLLYRIARAMPDREFLVLRGEWQTLEDIRELPNVRFMEPVDDMRDFYRECRLLLVPSVSEDAGSVAQEATLNGLPCISSNVGGLVETNAGGVLLKPDDLRAWVRAIELLDNADVRESIVARQQRCLDSTCQTERLDQLARAIEQLS